MSKSFFKTKKFKAILLVFTIVCILNVRHIIVSNGFFYLPEVEKQDISFVFSKNEITDADLDFLFEQTGISPYSSRELINQGRTEIFELIQDKYFEKPEIKKNYICFPFTAEERTIAEATPLVNLKNGDILLTFNTQTCDWRHGHCAIVTDAEKGIILEHVSVGETSCFSRANKWGKYPSFAVLRYPDEKIAEKVAQYARESLIDIDYNIFAGLIKKDKSKEEKPESSHCVHIVWQGFKAFGVDIDSDGGRIVTTNDIAMSDELKVIQIHGIDPQKFENRILR